jgi:multidrug efflux pump subunit AcrA (membrane-fusion protein)
MNKLGKIAPIIVIVACLGSLYLAYSLGNTKKQLTADKTQLTQDLDSNRMQLGQAQSQLKKDADLLKQAKSDLDKANTDLASTQSALTNKTEEADALQAKNGEMEKELQAAKTELTSTKETIRTIQEITQTTDVQDLGKLREKLTAQADENKMLGEQLVSMRQENADLKQKVTELTTTPAGVRGRISLVENNWGFVVLDIGDAQRVRRNSEFLVYRDSKLVGKVQIVSVSANTCIGQIMPGYPSGPPRPGDMAVH